MLQAKCDGQETGFFCRIVKVEIKSNDCGFAQVQLELVFNLRLKMMTLELPGMGRKACVLLPGPNIYLSN